jgi:hypothetical protein
MKTVTACFGSAACLALALVSVAKAQEKQAAQNEPGFHRIEIYNGPARMVHYSSFGASTGEQTLLRDVERGENEAALADQLLALRRQYVRDESILEKRRSQVQELFYGYWSVLSPSLVSGAALTTYPFASSISYPFGYSYYAPYNYAYPYYTSVGSGTSVNGLYGVGDEGRIKTELARTLAVQATPEYAAQAYRQYNNALARAGESDSRIAKVVGAPSKGGIRPLSYEPAPGESPRLTRPGAHVVVNTRLGNTVEKVEGTVVSDAGDWLVLDTKAGQLSIAKSAIITSLEPK